MGWLRDRKSTVLYARICLAFSLCFASSWLLNITIYAQTVLPVARDIASVAAGVAALTATVIAVRRPGFFKEQIGTPVFLSLQVAGVAVAAAGINLQSPVLVVLGATMRSLGAIWIVLMAGVSLIAVPAKRAAAILVGAYVLSSLWEYAASWLSTGAATLVYAVLPVLVVALVRPSTVQAFSQMAGAGSRADLEVTSPRYFIPFTHVLFVTIIVFNAATGFALAFGSTDSMPQEVFLSVAPLMAVAAVALRKDRFSADRLFMGAALLVVAGLLFISVSAAASPDILGPWVNILLAAGSNCFTMLVYFVLSRVAARNAAGTLSMYFFYSAAIHLGIEGGAMLGHFANALEAVQPAIFAAFVGAVVFAFVAYNLIVLRSFSFEATVLQVVPASEVFVRAEAPQLEKSCLVVAGRYRLTPRETEIMELLARGRNVQAIQEKLVVSRNTVKTHIKNIYVKTGVHSQQELIELAETAL